MDQRGQSLYAKGHGGGSEGEGEEADESGRLERSGDKRCQDSKYQQILPIQFSYNKL